ncbi:MAG: hypothetical protein K9M03_02160 [Kiritimatiellales bacterium]|nr:hypothetical protein [Kiritimatiellales bacterium]
MTLTNILLSATLIGIGIVLFKVSRTRGEGDPLLEAELDRRKEEIGELKGKLDEQKSELNELKGKGKQLSADYMKAQAKNEELGAQVAEFKAQQKQREQDQEHALVKLDAAEKSLADEKLRIRREDEERLQKAEEERDRMWAEHEISVVSLLTDLCKKRQYSFTCYDNTTLPEEEGFRGHFKPDFVISFLDQFVIFDAKVSKSENIQKYIQDNVKSTAKKAKGKENIYPTIFFVVPTEAMKELKQTAYYEDGFTFYAVSPEALEPILASLKKIATYELAQEMDPQERENIIDLIAQFDFHISTRNTIDYGLMQHGLDTLSRVQSMNPDLIKEVAVKKGKMRNLNMNTAENKQMIASPEALHQKLLELVEPKAKIAKEDVRG